jgi:hypothetical protein
MAQSIEMNIKFSCAPNLLGAIPAPVPSYKAIPEYFKKIKPQSDSHPMNGTVKRCIPFLDAMSVGFVIPLWCDVFVVAKDGSMSVDFPPNFPQPDTLGSHALAQIPSHPLAEKPYGDLLMKWINPWVIETDDGVSCMFTSPLNHIETRFKLMDGVVDTDTYYNHVNFPFVWTGGDGEFFIPKGTPLVQVVPFRRQQFALEICEMDQTRLNHSQAVLGTKIKNAYKDEFWHRKTDKQSLREEQE